MIFWSYKSLLSTRESFATEDDTLGLDPDLIAYIKKALAIHRYKGGCHKYVMLLHKPAAE